MDVQKEKQAFEEWKAFVKDEELQRQLAEMEGKEELLSRYFTAPLRFGTAGLRGIMAPGVGAMNLYTVARATRGLAQYLLHGSGVADAAARGVVIGRDSRIHSADFACVTAGVLAACGIRVYLFDDLRPTPMVSFAVRDLHAVAGVNITASHNPKEYNGYKVYYEDGRADLPRAGGEDLGGDREDPGAGGAFGRGFRTGARGREDRHARRGDRRALS